MSEGRPPIAERFGCPNCQIAYEAGLRLARMEPNDPRWWGLWNQFVMALEGSLHPEMVPRFDGSAS